MQGMNGVRKWSEMQGMKVGRGRREIEGVNESREQMNRGKLGCKVTVLHGVR